MRWRRLKMKAALCLAVGPAALAAGVAPPGQAAAEPPHRRQDLVVEVVEQVEDAQLVLAVGPDLRQQRRVQRRAVGHHHPGPQAPGV
jgi:hypothetical protein